jgi:hypothetical protein
MLQKTSENFSTKSETSESLLNICLNNYIAMKKGIYLIMITAICGMFIGCSKDDNGGLKASMSAQINSTDWNTASRVTLKYNDRFVITGSALDGETLEITIYGSTEGTYQGLLQCGAIYKATLGTSLSDAYVAVSGTVELTNVNTSSQEISGTFSFTLTRLTSTITVTNGSFSNLKYTVMP